MTAIKRTTTTPISVLTCRPTRPSRRIRSQEPTAKHSEIAVTWRTLICRTPRKYNSKPNHSRPQAQSRRRIPSITLPTSRSTMLTSNKTNRPIGKGKDQPPKHRWRSQSIIVRKRRNSLIRKRQITIYCVLWKTTRNSYSSKKKVKEQ